MISTTIFNTYRIWLKQLHPFTPGKKTGFKNTDLVYNFWHFGVAVLNYEASFVAADRGDICRGIKLNNKYLRIILSGNT